MTLKPIEKKLNSLTYNILKVIKKSDIPCQDKLNLIYGLIQESKNEK